MHRYLASSHLKRAYSTNSISHSHTAPTYGQKPKKKKKRVQQFKQFRSPDLLLNCMVFDLGLSLLLKFFLWTCLTPASLRIHIVKNLLWLASASSLSLYITLWGAPKKERSQKQEKLKKTRRKANGSNPSPCPLPNGRVESLSQVRSLSSFCLCSNLRSFGLKNSFSFCRC